MTRRQWLAKNPPPAPAGPLLDRAQQLEQQGDAPAAAEMRKQAQLAPAKCPTDPGTPIYRHRDRPEDLYTCPKGPHFLLWTLNAGRPQLVRTQLKDLPDFDKEMPGAI